MAALIKNTIWLYSEAVVRQDVNHKIEGPERTLHCTCCLSSNKDLVLPFQKTKQKLCQSSYGGLSYEHRESGITLNSPLDALSRCFSWNEMAAYSPRGYGGYVATGNFPFFTPVEVSRSVVGAK